MCIMKRDKRINLILSQIFAYANGEYNCFNEPSNEIDEIDTIFAALNSLGESLLEKAEINKKKEEDIERILNIMVKYAASDFREEIELKGVSDETDALAVGLNALREEILSKTYQE